MTVDTTMQLPVRLSASSIESYLDSISSIPVLTAAEERSLALRYKNSQDLEAARSLIISNLRFVIHVARGYQGYGLALGDLIQEGNIGLMKAVKRFDPDRGVRLISFAVHWIRAEIHEFIIRNWRIVKVATTKAQRKLFFNLRSSKKRLGWLNRSEAETVAKDLNVPTSVVLEMERRLAAPDQAFDAPSEADDDGHSSGPSHFIANPIGDPALLLEHDDSVTHHRQQLQAGLATLDPRSRDILEQRWLSDQKQTLKVLAERYQVSMERIRQLETNALNKLRQQLTA